MGRGKSLSIKLNKISKNIPVAVITRATLRISKLISFGNLSLLLAWQLKNAEGVIYFKGIGEWPFIQQATLSIWKSIDHVNKFAYSNKTHLKIIEKTRKQKWYSEDLFARFQVISDTGFIGK